MKTSKQSTSPVTYVSPETGVISLGLTENILTSGGTPESLNEQNPYGGGDSFNY